MIKYITREKLNLISSYLHLFVSVVVPLILTPLFLYHFGQKIYGIWVLLGSVISYFSLTNFGFGTMLLKELSRDANTEELNRDLNTIIFFLFKIGVTVGIFAAFLYIYLDKIFLIPLDVLNTARKLFVIMFIIFFINLIGNNFSVVLFAKNDLYLKNSVMLLHSILFLMLVYIFLRYGVDIVGIAMLQMVLVIIEYFILYKIAKQRYHIRISKKYFDPMRLKEYFSPSLHYFLISLSVIIVFQTDNLVIASFLSLSSVAVYSIAFRLIYTAQSILFKFSDIMIPDISRLYHQKKFRQIKRLHNRLQIVTMIFAFGGYGLLYFLGSSIIEWWVGKENLIEQNIFNVLLIFALVHAWIHVSGIFISAIGIHQKASYSAMIEAVLNLLLSIWWARSYGLMGVAMGTLVASLLTNAWVNPYLFYRHMNQKIGQTNG